jgi:hypothetical protein
MAEKERYQNPVIGDTLKLRLFTYNANNRADVYLVDSVEVYAIETNSEGTVTPRLVETVPGDMVTKVETGQYLATVNIDSPLYTIGEYQDIWKVKISDDLELSEIVNQFEVHSDLWFTSTAPMIYDFDIRFLPNRVRKGSKRYLLIQCKPNVPTGSEMEAYYANLAATSPLRIYIEQTCGECLPEEEDLRMVVEGALVEHREKCYAYYFLDTTDMDLGLYDIWFEFDFGECTHISEKQQLQIF